MSNFNDLYDHVAADRTRAIQLLGIQDIRRKAIAELLAANAYTEPANIDAMTEQEREQHKAEAAYALGRPHILEVAQVPAPNSDETYAMAVGATSEHPNCIALCIQTKLEELYMSGIVERSATHHPRLFVVAANDAPDEDVQGLSAALDMLRVTYPDFQIVLNERTPEQAMRAALSDELRDTLDACKINNSQENYQRLTATLAAAPLYFPAQRPDGAAADTGIIIDPGVGSGLALTREMLQTLQAQTEFIDQMRAAATELGLDFDADAISEAARNINVDEPEKTERKERRWFGKKKK